jgi:hypothetical protein
MISIFCSREPTQNGWNLVVNPTTRPMVLLGFKRLNLMQSESGFLISHCLPIILAEAVQCPNDPPRVLGCVNALARLTAILWFLMPVETHLKSIFSQFSRPLPDHCQSESLRLCLNWLHFPSTDSIGFQAVSALANLLELHRSHCGWWIGLFNNYGCVVSKMMILKLISPSEKIRHRIFE